MQAFPERGHAKTCELGGGAGFAWRRELFASATEHAVVLAFLALANFSKFACNLPILVRGGRRDVAYWPVLSGPMLRIFVIDAVLTVIDTSRALPMV